MTGVDPTHRPTRVASLLAVLAAGGAVGAVATLPAQRAAILTVIGAVIVFGAADVLIRRGYRPLGGVVGLVGVGMVVVGMGLGFTFTSGYTPRAELLPGLVGIAVLGVGVLGPHRALSRRLVSAGLVLLLIGVVLSGLVKGADAAGLLAAVALAVVAWDAGEHAISLGEQLGREARTWPVEAMHVATSGLVGASGAAGALVLAGLVGTRRIPLGGLVVMLAAVVLLLVALSGRAGPHMRSNRQAVTDGGDSS